MMSYVDDYTRDYHNEQQQLSYVNGTSDQFVYNFEPESHSLSREKMEEHDRLTEKLRNDPEYQRELQQRFLRMAHFFCEDWHKDKTPPEKRNRLFYARRLASLYETLERKTEYFQGFSREEWKSLDNASERYAELVSILEGKTPQEHYTERWRFRETKWRYWPQINRKEAVSYGIQES